MPNEINAYSRCEDYSRVRIVPAAREYKRPEVYGAFTYPEPILTKRWHVWALIAPLFAGVAFYLYALHHFAVEFNVYQMVIDGWNAGWSRP
jgi:hypothetical protein